MTDDAIMNPGNPATSAVSVTVFLSDPEYYDGAALTIAPPSARSRSSSPRRPCNSRSEANRFAPVTRGWRVAAVSWVQSLVRDPVKRQLPHGIARIKQFFCDEKPDAPETDLAHQA